MKKEIAEYYIYVYFAHNKAIFLGFFQKVEVILSISSKKSSPNPEDCLL